MNTKTLLLVSFFAGLGITIAGALLKILHEEGAETFLIAGVITSLVFVITAIYEVVSSRQISKLEKALWITGFICSGGIAGILYLVAGREKVVIAS